MLVCGGGDCVLLLQTHVIFRTWCRFLMTTNAGRNEMQMKDYIINCRKGESIDDQNIIGSNKFIKFQIKSY